MDPQQKKIALRAINYGLYVATAVHDGEYAAAGVNWLTQASFEPPLVVLAAKADSGLRSLVTASGAFAVNVLASDQVDVAKDFFRSTTVEGDLICGHRFEPGPATGSPLLVETPWWFECRTTDVVDRGDHTIFVAEVVEAGVREGAEERRPLVLRDTGMNYGG
ncbi:MAG: flavin reductase [Acidimicrobiales bacterium]|nr:MAG: flavin reductase [Acidimicrobiales bacterium]